MITKNRIGILTPFLFVIINLFQPYVYAETIEYSVLYTDYIGKEFPSQSFTINNVDSLNILLEKLKKKPESINVDFNKQVVSIIVPDRGLHPDQIEIKRIYKPTEDRINVEYTLNSVHYVPEKDYKPRKPYIVLALKTAIKDNPQVSFQNVNPRDPVFANQSLGNSLNYKNTLTRGTASESLLGYIAFDTGNSWTYEIESDFVKGYQTFSVISHTNGWSIFDFFFGRSKVGMQLTPHGQLIIHSGKWTKTFYTPGRITVTNPKEPFEVKAGKFKDTIVISSKPNSPITFKDIYAKDVGLIYHEHSSPRGSAKYSLTNANIMGRNIP